MKFPLATAATVGMTAPLSDSPTSPIQLGSAESLRSRLTSLRENAELANRELAIAAADLAVTAAERSHSDPSVAAYLVYLADRRLAAAEGTRGGFAMDRRPTRVEKRNCDDRLQQKIALGTWEDEGGSAAEHATPNTVTSTSDNRRCT